MGAKIYEAIRQVGAWLRETFTVWRILTVACIVFAAGISGTWFNDQFSGDLQVQRWGWFGATIAGVAIFSGVMLAVDSLEPVYVKREQGDSDEIFQEKLDRAVLIKKIGFMAGCGAVFVGVVADCVMSAAYFGAGHDLVIAIVLGFYPSVLSVIGGTIEGVRGISRRSEKRKDEENEVERDIKLQIELAKIEARKQIAIQKQLLLTNGKSAEQSHSSVNVREQSHSSVNVRELTADEQSALADIRKQWGTSVFSSAQAEGSSPLGRTKTYEVLGRAEMAGSIEKVERGKWRFK